MTARIANIGNAPGTFPGIVTLDGDNVAKNDLTLSAESLGAVTLKFVPPTNGEHILKFGGLSENLTVKKMIDKQVELKYDNDYFGASLSAGAGHIIDFSPPATPFTVKQIKVFGRLSAKVPGYENNPFDLQILDKNLKVIYTSTYTYNKFSRPRRLGEFRRSGCPGK